MVASDVSFALVATDERLIARITIPTSRDTRQVLVCSGTCFCHQMYQAVLVDAEPTIAEWTGERLIAYWVILLVLFWTAAVPGRTFVEDRFCFMGVEVKLQTPVCRESFCTKSA